MAVATTPARKRKPASKRKASRKRQSARQPVARRVAKKWMRGPADVAAVKNGCYFDNAAGERVCDFFENFLCLYKGRKWAGKPFMLLPWERDLLMRLFGWKRADGLRRFHKAFVEIAKKNGKSALASAIALYMLMGDREPGAEVYCAATSRQQAAIVWSAAHIMAEASASLKGKLQFTPTKNNIAHPASNSFCRAASAEAGVNEGWDAHCVIFDEIHALKNRTFFDALEYAGAAREQPLMFIITTAGYDRTTVAYELHKYAEGVISGSIQDDEFFAYICAVPDDSEWDDPTVWHLANPSMGVLFTKEAFLSVLNEEKASEN